MNHILRAGFHALHLLAAALLASVLSGAAGAADSSSTIAALYASHVDMRLAVPKSEAARYAKLAQQTLQRASIQLDAPQYLLLVDRSPKVQAVFLFWFAPPARPVLIGASPASTGRIGVYDHFETPTGVFEHSAANPDFRAEGTFNELGIRGLGERGLRVFDFGWQRARRGWGEGGMSAMRLVLHATDPEFLEPLLGSVQSQGCIRIPTTLALLLDIYGLLDADYANALAEGRHFWALPPDHQPVAGAGRYLIVVDSARTRRPSWSPGPYRLHRQSTSKTAPARPRAGPPTANQVKPL